VRESTWNTTDKSLIFRELHGTEFCLTEYRARFAKRPPARRICAALPGPLRGGSQL